MGPVPTWIVVLLALLAGFVIWRVGIAMLRSLTMTTSPASDSDEPAPVGAGGRGRPRRLPRVRRVRHGAQGVPPRGAPDPTALRREDAGHPASCAGLSGRLSTDSHSVCPYVSTRLSTIGVKEREDRTAGQATLSTVWKPMWKITLPVIRPPVTATAYFQKVSPTNPTPMMPRPVQRTPFVAKSPRR